MTTLTEGTILWEPSEELETTSIVRAYMDWLKATRGLDFASYAELWQWSVDEIEAFWASVWDFFHIQATPYSAVLESHRMPGAHWFPGARLNYAEHVFRNRTPDHPAVIFQSERHSLTKIAWDELYRQTAAVAQALREMGVKSGDRVVAYMPNIPQALVAFLACASLGAVWSSCSPDFGSGSVVDRFKQIEPKVLFAVDGYQYGGKSFDRRDTIAEIQRALPTLEHTVIIPYLSDDPAVASQLNGTLWQSLLDANTDAKLAFEAVPFDHPLWVLYSSGTTGLPKPIVQGQGGILLEHIKALALQHNLKPGDRFFWFTTTGWMMWNLLIGGLLVGSTVLLYDGSPAYPDIHVLWRFAADSKMTVFGTSASYILSCIKAGAEPRQFDLSALQGLGSTGSPLPVEGFLWVFEHVKPLWLASVSGGTDVCTAFISASPLLPVRAGELQCRALGCRVEAFDEEGRPLLNEVGELVVTEPMPSMPLYFWNDPDMRRYTDAYYAMYPDVWRHGDWIKITLHGGAVIYGRSDSTLNRMGVRMGTSELYSAVEGVPEVVDSLVIDLEGLGGRSFMPLFVVLRPGVTLDDALRARIKARIRETLSPRHVPDEIYAVSEIPRTLNGKKLEVPIKKILMGMPVERAANVDSMSNPDALKPFIDLAQELK